MTEAIYLYLERMSVFHLKQWAPFSFKCPLGKEEKRRAILGPSGTTLSGLHPWPLHSSHHDLESVTLTLVRLFAHAVSSARTILPLHSALFFFFFN